MHELTSGYERNHLHRHLLTHKEGYVEETDGISAICNSLIVKDKEKQFIDNWMKTPPLRTTVARVHRGRRKGRRERSFIHM
jgi:hypothetical protein